MIRFLHMLDDKQCFGLIRFMLAVIITCTTSGLTYISLLN